MNKLLCLRNPFESSLARHPYICHWLDVVVFCHWLAILVFVIGSTPLYLALAGHPSYLSLAWHNCIWTVSLTSRRHNSIIFIAWRRSARLFHRVRCSSGRRNACCSRLDVPSSHDCLSLTTDNLPAIGRRHGDTHGDIWAADTRAPVRDDAAN